MKRTQRSMRQILIPLIGVAVGASIVSLQAFPIITDVVETGGDNEDTDTVTAKWTGVTFTNGVANEPIPGTPADAPYTVGLFTNLAPAFVDRDHAYTGATPDLPIPDYLVGNEYIMIGNDNKNNANFQLDVTVSQDCLVYLLIDNRCGDNSNNDPPVIGPGTGVMEWVDTNVWVPMLTGWNRAHNIDQPDEIGIDEHRNGSIDNWFCIYRSFQPAGTFSTFEQNNGGGRNMYGIVVAPAPSGPSLIGVSARAIGFTATIDDYGMVDIDTSSVKVTLDGQDVTPDITKVYTFTRVNYLLPKGEVFDPGSHHTLAVSAKDTDGKEYNWTMEFDVPQYPIIPADWAVASATDRGMNAEVYMMEVARGPGNENTVPNAEMQWARGYIDPQTGQPYMNLCDPTNTTVNYVNWAQIRDTALTDPYDIDDTPEDGPDHFNSALPAGNPIPNDWIPGTLLFTEQQINHIVVQVTCYLYLKKGYYLMGVNSDDGFRVSVAPGQPDVFGMTLGEYGTGRSASDTLFDFYVPKDGYYPFRLLWWEGTGGASCEWFTVDPYTGEYFLINSDQPGAIQAYRTAVGRAHVVRMVPAVGWQGTLSNGYKMQWVLEDGSTTVVPDSIKVIWDGQEAANVTVQKMGSQTIVTYPVQADYGIQDHTGAFIWAESNGQVWTNEFAFRTLRDWQPGEIQAQLINNVVETGGDAEQVDTLVAQWTGQTFTNGVAGEPRVGSAIEDPYTVGLFVNGAPAYVDRPHIWVAASPDLPIPDYLLGGEYIMVGNDNKNNTNYSLTISVNPPVMAYLLIDNRFGDGNSMDPPALGNGNMDWVLNDGWEPVKTGHNPFGNPDWPDMIGIDEGANGDINGYVSIYRKRIDTSTFSTYECLTGNNMYGVVITQVPAEPPEFTKIGLTEDGKVVLEWKGEGTLLEADEVTGPWTPVQGATSPYTITPTGKKKFYRLKQ